MQPTESSAPLLNDTLSVWMRDAFRKALAPVEDDFASVDVVVAANPEFGDFQCNAALPLAKLLRQSPRKVAEAVVALAGEHPCVAKLEVAGPGFINVTLHNAALVEYLVRMEQSDALGVPQVGAGRTVVLDYSSPNVAKPMHIGHIRSTIIGSALDRLHRRLGYRVVADNHIGDWGTQFGILIKGYHHFVDQEKLRERPVEELERIYVKSYEQSKADPAWLDACRQELVKLQAGDADNHQLWVQFVQWSMTEFERMYARLGVRFDFVRGESYYNDKLPGVLALLGERGLARESEGAQVVFLEEEGLPVCIVRKRDGAFNYATTDLATVQSRVAEFKPEKIVYVTDERQQLHFRQIIAICRRIGITTDLQHVWFGLMRLPEGTFSTRQGNVIRLESLLDEAESRALAIVQASSPQMEPAKQREIARAVGIGAVKYADLSQNPQTQIVFTWDKALALDGNSGPYLQYAYARIASVRDKYAERHPGQDPETFPLQITEPIERTLAVTLSRFPETIVRAAAASRPSIVADYLFDLSKTYSSFYQNVPFLKAPEGIRESRVRLCGLVARVLRAGLDLLGIETPERI
ncbi:MAG: arginine--tRNA ligase [Verrucomicrobia bacterium]|nr:arginine--tRNA ligase [Verrucomicrobiota bacterium]